VCRDGIEVLAIGGRIERHGGIEPSRAHGDAGHGRVEEQRARDRSAHGAGHREQRAVVRAVVDAGDDEVGTASGRVQRRRSEDHGRCGRSRDADGCVVPLIARDARGAPVESHGAAACVVLGGDEQHSMARRDELPLQRAHAGCAESVVVGEEDVERAVAAQAGRSGGGGGRSRGPGDRGQQQGRRREAQNSSSA